MKTAGDKDYGWPGLDDGVRHYVVTLRKHDVDTCQSCEGGHGHAYTEPTVEFYGRPYEGARAVSVAPSCGFPVAELRRVWTVMDGEMTGPHWAMTFHEKADVWQARIKAQEKE